MTEAPYGTPTGQGYATTETPYGPPPADEVGEVDAAGVAHHRAPTVSEDGFSEPVITEVTQRDVANGAMPNGASLVTGVPTTTGVPPPAASAPPVAPSPPSGTPTAATAERAPRRAASATRTRGPRRARLQLRHINPWTALKFACVLSIALFFVWLIVIGVLFGILEVAGVIGKINDAVTKINGPGSKAPVTPGIVFGGAAIVGVVNIILFIALSSVGSVVYNLCADLVGGIEVTLSERDT